MSKTRMFVALCAAVLAQMAWAVDFPAADADGTVTLTATGTYSASIPNGTKKLVVNAGGEAVLSAASTGFTGPVVIKSGSTLKVTNKDAVSKASSVTVESGGTLHANFNGTGQWNKVFTNPIYIAGAGNGGIGAFKFTNAGSTSADSIVKTLILTADATIDCSKRWGITNGGGAGTLDLQGHTLTRIGSDNLMLVSLTVTPGKFINKAGTVTFQNNGGGPFYVKDGCKGEDTVFQFEGGTLTFWNTGAYVPYKVILNGGKLTAGSGNAAPPRNSISGPVEVNFWMTIATDWMKHSNGTATTLGLMGSLSIASGKAVQLDCDRTLYVGGPISGSGQLKASNHGRISIQADDLGKVQPVMQGGTIECDVGNGLIGMLRCANGGGVYGVFRHKRGDLSFSSGDNPRVGESANSFGAYVFESGKMCPSNTFYLAAENAGSHGLFLQRGGHFDLKANPQTDADKQFRAGACNAEIAFVQAGGTNDTLYGRIAADGKERFALCTKGSTNMLFSVSGSNTVFRTDTFSFACATNRTQGVIAINDGASFKARRFTCPTTKATGSDVTLSLNGGVIYPLFHSGWANVGGSTTGDFLKRAPDHAVVFEKGVVFDTSECLTDKGALASSQIPLTLKAPEGQGIASIAIPTEASSVTYHGPVPVEIRGPAGSYGAAAYADFDFSTKKLSKIVVVSPGCNYDATTKIYVRSPDCKSRYACPTFTLTGPQTSGGLVKRGANAVQMYSVCTYQGGTVVEGGTLSMYGNGFPNNTALTVRKGATFNGGNDSKITVSRLEGEGSVTTPSGLTVTEALVLDADRVFADGATALTSSGKVTFSDGATVEVSLTDAQKAAYRSRKSVAVLSAANGISGTPKLKVNGAEDGDWLIVNTGTALKFGPRHGMSIIVR